jgi:hypothetical protein
VYQTRFLAYNIRISLPGSTMQLEQRARSFAIAAHARVEQTCHYTGEPYIVHPARVVELLRSVPHTETMLAVAWLQDTVRDTGVEPAMLERVFGAEVAAMVLMISDVSRPEDGNRSRRKAMDRAHLAQATASAKTVKLAQLIDLACTVFMHDRAFTPVFARERDAWLEVLEGGDRTLWRQARDLAPPRQAESAEGGSAWRRQCPFARRHPLYRPDAPAAVEDPRRATGGRGARDSRAVQPG